MSVNTELIEGLKLTREESFIINCLRSEFGEDGNSELMKFNLSTINWNVVYEKSIQWHVTPLLHKIIKKLPALTSSLDIPREFLHKIKIAYLRTFLANETNFNKLTELVEVLYKAGIKVLLLKGSHLAQFVYHDIGLRPMADIDVMVEKKDLDKAEDLLFQMGYEYRIDEYICVLHRLRNDIEKAEFIEQHKNIYNHLPLLNNPTGIKHLEVHWTIGIPTSPFNIDIDKLWERAEMKKMNGTDILLLSSEDILLHLSFHASYHHKFRTTLLSYYDIATVIRDHVNKIDWNQVRLRAEEWGTEKYVYLTLRLSQEILGLNLPGNVLNMFKPKLFNEHISSEAKNRVLFPKTGNSQITTFNYLEIFRSDIGLIKKITYPFRKIFIPPAKMALKYSLPFDSKRIYFYYFVRIFSLILHKIPSHIKFVVHLLTHKKTDYHSFNLDTWLTPSNQGKSKAISKTLPS